MSILGLETPLPTHPAHFDLISIIRPNILTLQPYRCARDDYNTGILVDANENAIGHPIAVSTGNWTVSDHSAGWNGGSWTGHWRQGGREGW